MFDGQRETLRDLLEGLFHIAMADGFYHPNEDAFLETVAEIFGLSERDFNALKMRFAPDALQDPYTVLGVTPEMSKAEIRAVWRKLVRANHPDAMIARGLPEEALQLAQKRMADINQAWDAIESRAD
jgi:DnaJ like chaperone protein